MLSDIQKEMVEYLDNPCVISAGAGSGKSRVITYKFEYLVNNINIDPDKILCITFTNKAANELKNRLISKLDIERAGLLWVRTIHSACFKLIKDKLENYGFNSNISIYTDSDKKKILRHLLRNTEFEKKEFILSYFLELISKSKYIDFKDENELINIIYNKTIPEIFKPPEIRFNKEIHLLIYDIFIKYIFEMKYRQCLDYDDILFYTNRMLKDDIDFKIFVKNKFKYILVDEYQDIDHLQNNIIKNIISDTNITIVGDDNQSIYRFRGANPKIFINYKNTFPNAKLFKLEQNYRSTKQIIDMANALIKNNKFRIDKNCYSLKDGPKPNIKHFETSKEEAINIAKACFNLHNNGKFEYKDIAIIYRTRRISRSFESEFIKASIPYILVGDVEFFERREIKDIISYLEFSHNKNNMNMFERSIVAPRRRISINTLKTLLNDSPGENILEQLKYVLDNKNLNKKQFEELNKNINLIQSIENQSPKDAIDNIILNSNFREYIKSISNDDEDYSQRQENINELINVSTEFTTISEFLEDIFLNYNNKKNNDISSVQLMTGHASKGLEFKIVFLVGAEENTIPHVRALIEKNKEIREENIEEERRLFYVMMTRAEVLLTITWCDNRLEFKNSKISRFIKEIESFLNII